jgi:nitroreductase
VKKTIITFGKLFHFQHKKPTPDELFSFFCRKDNHMIELLRNRRSIRKYTEQPVEAEKLELLKEALLRSPSSKNINPWEFVFVTDKVKISQLKLCKPHGATPLETAPLAVVICADKTKNDVWVEDCSIASILLQLTAQSLGIGKLLDTSSQPNVFRNYIHLKNTYRSYSEFLKTLAY